MTRRGIITIIVAVLLLGGAAIYFLADPARSGLFPKCPFLMATGYKCPGCGSQRVLHSLLHGDVAAAWHYNALMVATLPVVVAYVVAELGRKCWPRLYNALNSVPAIVTVLVVIVAWWVLRNVMGW